MIGLGLNTQKFLKRKSLASNTYSLHFDGTDDFLWSANINDSTLDNIFDGGGTVSIWVKPDATPTNADAIIGKTHDSAGIDTGSGGWQIDFQDVAGSKVAYRFRVSFDNTIYDVRTNTSFSGTGWNNIVVTYNSASASNDAIIYIDGSAVTINDTASPVGSYVSDASSALTIGAIVASNKTLPGSSQLDGLVDEVMIWDSILTASEVKYLYNFGQGNIKPNINQLGSYSSASNCQAWFRMGDGNSDYNSVADTGGLIANEIDLNAFGNLTTTTRLAEVGLGAEAFDAWEAHGNAPIGNTGGTKQSFATNGSGAGGVHFQIPSYSSGKLYTISVNRSTPNDDGDPYVIQNTDDGGANAITIASIAGDDTIHTHFFVATKEYVTLQLEAADRMLCVAQLALSELDPDTHLIAYNFGADSNSGFLNTTNPGE